MNCSVHGFKMQKVPKSFFGDDPEAESEHICPVCAGWETACQVCGQVLYDTDGLRQHIRDKHLKTSAGFTKVFSSMSEVQKEQARDKARWEHMTVWSVLKEWTDIITQNEIQHRYLRGRDEG